MYTNILLHIKDACGRGLLSDVEVVDNIICYKQDEKNKKQDLVQGQIELSSINFLTERGSLL